MERSVVLAVYPDAALDRLTDRQLGESLDYVGPDVVLVERPYRRTRFPGGVATVALGGRDAGPVTDPPGPQVAVARTPDDLAALREHERRGSLDADAETFVLSDLLSVDVDLVALETSLDGREAYERALSAADLEGAYTHLTTTAAPGYRNDWGGLVVQGVRPGADETGASPGAAVAALSLHADGTVAADTYDPGRFGLEGLAGVGPTRAATLRHAGYASKSDVAAASVDDLRTLDGIGAATARRVRYAARARVDGRVYRTSSARLPGNDPVFVDVETDGLSPTMLWLIGVYDTRTDAYRSFLATDPDDRGAAVRAFASWYAENATDRPVVAYNGERFDFPHLTEHIDRYAPTHADAWRDAWTFDLRWWARTEDNAVLPGVTNALDDVASALGWDGDDTGLSGAVVGQRFRRWLADPRDGTELDWERHEAYCEGDVRALACVYDAVRDAEHVAGVAAGGGPTDTEPTETAQGTLGDFS
ncbi:MAG: ribonuclease H-like domain-containing protein [Halarchaeum sp.]